MAHVVHRALARPGTARNVTVVVAVLAMGALAITVVKGGPGVCTTAAKAAAQALGAFEHLYEFRREAAELQPTPIAASVDAPLWLRIARALAVTPIPLTAGELSAVLVADLASVEAALCQRAFVSGRDGWQLGAW